MSYDLTSNEVVSDKIVHVWSNGNKPARKIWLSDGTAVTMTLNHRMFGWDKFVYCEDMKVGDPISVIEKTPQQFEDVPLDDAFLLALWLAEGAKMNSSYMFASISPNILERVNEIADKNDWVVKKYGDCSYTVTRRGKIGVSPLDILKKYLGEEKTYGSRSKMIRPSIDKIRIPDAIFRANEQAVFEFVGTYIACDGCVINGKNHGLQITSVSERMVRDFVALLKRFGVASTVGSARAFNSVDGVRKPGRIAWRLGIFSREDYSKLSSMYLYDKDENFRSLLDWAAQPKRHTGSRCPTIPPNKMCQTRWSTKKTISDLCSEAQNNELFSRINNGLSWRRIVKIEEIEDCETWHLETQKTHLFFAEGVLSHNTKFENTATGFREAIAAGSITGSRGSRVLIDDPLSVESANSDAMRASTLEWFTEAVPTRLNSPKYSAIVVIMQRLHEEDVSGVILDRKGFKGTYDHICLPMRYEKWRDGIPTKLGYTDPRTEEGELLFPGRFPPEVVDDLEGKLGPYATAGQHQQAPTPRGGGIIKDSWWMPWDAPEFPELEFIVAGLDTAYSTAADTKGDYSALAIWGVFSGDPKARSTIGVDRYGKKFDNFVSTTYSDDLTGIPKVILMGAWAERLDIHELTNKVAADCKRFKVDKLLIENKAAGHSVAQEMRRLFAHEDFAVQMYDPKSIDKLGRLYSVQHLFSEGMIYAPDKEWAEALIRQVSTFPRGKHDDLVDVTSMPLRHLRDLGLLTRSPERIAEINEDKQHRGKPPAPLYGV